MDMYECNLPPYLVHGFDTYKKGIEEHSHLLASLRGRGLSVPSTAPRLTMGHWPTNKRSIVVTSICGGKLCDDMTVICEFIEDTPFLTDLQRDFHKTYLSTRYEALF